MDVAMTPEPAIVLRFVGVEIVEDDMDLVVRIIGDDPVHEVEELHPPATLLVSRQDLAIEIDALLAQKAPDLLFVDVAEIGGDQPSGPAAKAGRRRALEHRQNTLAGRRRVFGLRSAASPVGETCQILPRIPAAPETDR